MDVIEFFCSDALMLPRRQENEATQFLECLAQILDSYLQEIRRIEETDFLSKTIRGLADSVSELSADIMRSLEYYYQGSPHKSYSVIEKAIEDRRSSINRLISPKSMLETMSYLYRIRVGDRRVYRKAELFHLPFEMRHKAASYRYSLPGLPCLYLGGSTYVCWEELKRPEFGRIHISRYKPANDADEKQIALRVLDFSYRPAFIAALIRQEGEKIQKLCENSELVTGQAILWPLLAACSIGVRNNESPFKPEYILPQLVLQWIINNDVCDGLRYSSNNVFSYPKTIHPISNFVFPTKTLKPTGFCDQLMAKFWLTEPQSWELLSKSQLRRVDSPTAAFSFEIAKNTGVAYFDTEFAEIEGKLNYLECDALE